MRVIVLENGSMISDITCDREAVYVGSGDTCTIPLKDSRIGDRQVVIYPDADRGWVIEQLLSENPVQINGATITSRQELKTGDEIAIRDFVLRVFPEHAGQAVATPEISTSVNQLARFASFQLPPGTLVKKLDEPLTLLPAHLHRIGKLNLQLAQCTAVEPFMNIALQALLESFAAHKAWIGVRRVNYGSMDYVEGRLLTGKPTDLPDIGSKIQPRVADRAQFIQIHRVSQEDHTAVMAGPLAGPDGTLGMLYVDSGDTGRKFDLSDLDFFIGFSNLFAVQLDAILKENARNRDAMIDGQVSVVHEIQARLTPRKLPQWDGLQFGAFREPGRAHSGDVYDVVKLNNGMAAFMVAHTSATGAMPSMLIAQVQAAFRAAAMHQDAPHLFMQCMNWLLFDGQRDHPLDCIMAVADPNTGELRYCIAGELGAYIIGHRGDERPLMQPDASPSLGLAKTAPYQSRPEQLEPGESLVVFTPGVTTAKSRGDEPFGHERFVDILCDGFGQLASSMLKEMLTDLRSFTEGGSQPSDVTVLLMHRVAR